MPENADKKSDLKPAEPAKPAKPEIVHSPIFRNFVHFGAFVLLAIPFGALIDPRNRVPHGKTIVAGFMLFVALFNVLVLPRLPSGKKIFRPKEGLFEGPMLYPLALAVCVRVLPPFAAFAGWCVMAAGDAAASWAGRLMPHPKLPWNKKKSFAGLTGFIVASFPIVFLGLQWVPSELFLHKDLVTPEMQYVWTLAVLAACFAAVVESLDTRIDDNLRVPILTGLMLWAAERFLSFGTTHLPKHTHIQPEVLIRALVVNGIVGALVLLLKFSDLSGVLLGVVMGVIAYFFTGWQGYALFVLFVGAGSVASRIGKATKKEHGVTEAREGKRGVGNVAANLLVPTLCCLAYPIFSTRAGGADGGWLLAYAGALAAALADTISSEIGVLSKREPILITTRKPVAHGTNGAITLMGMIAAAVACGLFGLAGYVSDFWTLIHLQHPELTNFCSISATAIVIVAGMSGTIVDSLLGATVEDRVPFFHKGAVNFACTLTGAGVGYLGAILTR